jgi:hypothetical protein
MSGQTIEDYWKVSNDLDDLLFDFVTMTTREDSKRIIEKIKKIQQNYDLICTNAERRLIKS